MPNANILTKSRENLDGDTLLIFQPMKYQAGPVAIRHRFCMPLTPKWDRFKISFTMKHSYLFFLD